MIIQGYAECIKDGKVVRSLGIGDSFGESSLYESGVRSLSVRAGKDCICLGLSRNTLQEVLGAKIQEVIQGNWCRWAVEKNSVLKRLTKLQIEKWIQNSEVKKIPSDQILAEKGTLLKELFIVINGDIKYGDSEYSKGTVFGDKLIFPNASLKTKYSFFTNRLSHNLKTTSESELAIIKVDLFEKLIGGHLEDVFIKNIQSHEVKSYKNNRIYSKQMIGQQYKKSSKISS